jgi:regulation of enolase protein 1 (concanavalin A-like superfamily)
MSWPLSQDYNEAIQDPRSNFSDAELQAGEAVSNALGIPMPRSGNFADVYEMRCPSGARWAVKCFTREVHGLRERYAEISNYLRQVSLPFMVDFQYLERGIRVRGQWFPALKMQWVEGFVLNEFVRDNLDKKPILHALGQIWLRMARRLGKAKLAHCDLQHGNVMFVPGSTANSLAVKLIDYDGMCVPSLAGKNSGEVGHPAYQHPERLRTGAYNQEVDRFSLLSIAASLRCLTVGGRSLWERYDNGDNLLFRQADLQTPQGSPLFRELLTIGDPQAQLLVKELYRACQGPLSAAPLLTDLLLEEKPAGKGMTAVRQAAGGEETDWDFGDGEPGTVVVRKRRASGGMPLWAWGVLGGTAALLLSVGIGAGLILNNPPAKKEAPSIAPNKRSHAEHGNEGERSHAEHGNEEENRHGNERGNRRGNEEENSPNPTSKSQPPLVEEKARKEGLPKNKVDPVPLPQIAILPKADITAVKPPSLPNAPWGRPASTSGANFQEDEGKLTITLPGKDNAFDPQHNLITNRATVMRTVEGDFTAEVRIGGDFPLALDATANNRRVLLGAAGLLLHADKNNYMRLERSSRIQEKRGTFADLTLCQDGKVQRLHSLPLTGMETSFRLERRGDKIDTSINDTGSKWVHLKPLEIKLPAQVQIGVIALSTSRRPFLPSFDRFLFQQGQADMIRVEKWLTSADALDISNK